MVSDDSVDSPPSHPLTLMDLPLEMQLAILAYLSHRDLAAFGCVSQWAKESANRVAEQNAEQNLQQCFPALYQNHIWQGGVNYISLFKKAYDQMLDDSDKINVAHRRIGGICMASGADKKDCALLFIILHWLDYGNEDNKIALVRLLLDNGAHAERGSLHHGSFLIIAATQGEIEIVRLLLKRGADINAHSGQVCLTALMAAVHIGHTEIVRLLLDQGADVDRQDHRGITALMLAAQDGHTEIAQLLLDRGADIDLKDHLHFTAYAHAVQMQHAEVAELLLHAQEQRKEVISVQPQPTAF